MRGFVISIVCVALAAAAVSAALTSWQRAAFR